MAALILLVLLGLWLGKTALDPAARDASRASGTRSTTVDGVAAGNGGGSLPTKASVRPAGVIHATHSPARLREFYLPPLEIDGLTLAAAVEKLRAAYEEACLQSGEVPVALSFVIPPGVDGLIHLKLPGQSLDTSLRMLAAVSRLRIQRKGAEYRFDEVDGEEILASKELHAPPDLLARLAAMAGQFPDSAGLRERLEAIGLELDPATRLTFNPAWGMVEIESITAADRAGLASLLGILEKEVPLQHKLETKIVQLPADMEWTEPDLSRLDDAAIQLVMRQLAQTKGVELMTAPSITARGGEDAKIEIVRELIAPLPGSTDEYETQNVGVVFDFTPNPLGFGHALDVNFTATSGDIDPVTGKVAITEDAHLEGSGFTGDQHTRLQVQTHPDGSRTVLMVTPSLVDATGRLVHPAE